MERSVRGRLVVLVAVAAIVGVSLVIGLSDRDDGRPADPSAGEKTAEPKPAEPSVESEPPSRVGTQHVDDAAPLAYVDDPANYPVPAGPGDAWGQAVEGVQMRLRADKDAWTTGETPTFKADFRNGGERPLGLALYPENWEVEVDGAWYHVSVLHTGTAGMLGFGAGQEHADVPFALHKVHGWRMRDVGQELELTPGKHTIRLAFRVQPGKGEQEGVVRPVSNPVEIEIRLPVTFLGLDLTYARRTTDPADLPALWEERPPGSNSYELRAGVVVGRHPEHFRLGDVYYVPDKDVFYVQHAPLWASTLIYYGPFTGKPWERLGIPEAETVGLTGITALPDTPQNRRAVLEAAARPVWITLLSLTPVKSMAEWRAEWRARALQEEKLDPGLVELEIRTADNEKRVARLRDVIRLPENMANKRGLSIRARGRAELGERTLRTMDELPDGEYLMAVSVDAVRCSNVAPLRIDSEFDPRNEPTLRLVPLPLGPGQELPYVGLVATGPDPMDPEFTNMAVAFPALVVDDVERRLEAMVWNGPVAPLRPGQRNQQMIDLALYTPEIAPKPQYRVKARVGKYESAPVTIPAEDPLGRLWDVGAPVAGEDKPAWSEAVEGVQARLRPEKAVWPVGETPSLTADVRNLGERDLFVAQAQQLCEIDFDGQWYLWVGELGLKSSAFGPGREYTGIPVVLDEHWQSKLAAGVRQGLELAPGKHTVRIAFIAEPNDDGEPVRAVSNPVEIEILPARREASAARTIRSCS